MATRCCHYYRYHSHCHCCPYSLPLPLPLLSFECCHSWCGRCHRCCYHYYGSLFICRAHKKCAGSKNSTGNFRRVFQTDRTIDISRRAGDGDEPSGSSAATVGGSGSGESSGSSGRALVDSIIGSVPGENDTNTGRQFVSSRSLTLSLSHTHTLSLSLTLSLSHSLTLSLSNN